MSENMNDPLVDYGDNDIELTRAAGRSAEKGQVETRRVGKNMVTTPSGRGSAGTRITSTPAVDGVTQDSSQQTTGGWRVDAPE